MEEQTAEQIRAALEIFQRAGGGRLLLGRAGLSAPGRWQRLSAQWDRQFPSLPAGIDVTIRRAHS